MKTNLIKYAFVLGTLLATAGCQSSGNYKETLSPTKIASLKEGLVYMHDKTNFTIDVAIGKTTYYSVYFSDKYVGTDSEGAATLDLYIKDGDKGIYSLNYTNDEFVSGEYYVDESGKKYTDLYDNTLVKSLYHVGDDFVWDMDDNATESAVTDKRYRIAFIEAMGIDSKSYASLTAMSVKYVDGTIVFNVDFGDYYKYVCTVHDFGSTTNNHYHQFMKKGGKVYKPNATLSRVRSLLQMNNFVRSVYDLGAEGYTCYEYFHEHYFFTKYVSTTDVYGYMAMDCEETAEHPALHGCYYFYTEKGYPHFNSMAFSTDPDIVKFFHYPIYMDLLSHLQFLTKVNEVDDPVVKLQQKSEKYYLSNSALIKNFATNFSIDQSFPFDECPPYGIVLETLFSEKDEDCIMIFHYLMKYNGQKYDYPIPVSMFGTVGNATLDEVYKEYNTK